MLLLTAGMTGVASFLNSFFWELDFAILSFYHSVYEAAGTVLSPVMYFISLLGKGGYFLLAVSAVMIIFKKTRRTGICCLAGIIIGALFTNITIKPLVQRPRPYDFDLVNIKLWWEGMGRWRDVEHDFSFPSGHVTAAADFSVAFCFTRGKKYIPWAILFICLMGISRNYLMMHYPTDVLAGMIIGTCAGLLSGILCGLVFKKLDARKSIISGKGE